MATPFKYLQPVETQFVPRYASPNTQLLASSAQSVEQQYQTAKQNYDKLDLAFDNVREQVAGMPEGAQQFVEGYIQDSKEELDSLVETGGYRGSMAAITSMAKKFNRDITPIVQDSEKFKLGIQAINESNADAFGKTVLTDLAKQSLTYNPDSRRLESINTQEFTNIANNWVNLSDYFQDYLSNLEETTFIEGGQQRKGVSSGRAIDAILDKLQTDDTLLKQVNFEAQYYAMKSPSYFPEEMQEAIQTMGDDFINQTFELKQEGSSSSIRMTPAQYVAMKKANPGFNAEVVSDYVEDEVTTTGKYGTRGFTPLGITSLAERSGTVSLEGDGALYTMYTNATDYLSAKTQKIDTIDESLRETHNYVLDLLERIDPNLPNQRAVIKNDNTGFLEINTDVISEEEAFGRNRELLSSINRYNDLISDKKQIEAGFSYLNSLGEDAIRGSEFLKNTYDTAYSKAYSIKDPWDNLVAPVGLSVRGLSSQGVNPPVFDEEFIQTLTDNRNISVKDGKVTIDDSVFEQFKGTPLESSVEMLLSTYKTELQRSYDKAITEEIEKINSEDKRYEADAFLIHKDTTDPLYNFLVETYANQSVAAVVGTAIETSEAGSRVIIGNQDVNVDSAKNASALLYNNGVQDYREVNPAESFKFAYDEQGRAFLIFKATSAEKSIEVHLFGQEANNLVEEYTNSNPQITYQARSRLFGSFDERIRTEQEINFDESYLRTTFGIGNLANLNIKRSLGTRTGVENYTATFDIIKPDGSIETKEITSHRDNIYNIFLELASQ